MEKIKDFFSGVKKEVKRVRWPDKKTMFKSAGAVLAFCVFFGAYFYIINVIVVVLKDVLQ